MLTAAAEVSVLPAALPLAVAPAVVAGARIPALGADSATAVTPPVGAAEASCPTPADETAVGVAVVVGTDDAPEDTGAVTIELGAGVDADAAFAPPLLTLGTTFAD